MKKQIFTLLMALVLTMGTALMAQTPATTNDQTTDETGQPETGPGPDVDVDTGASASGAVDVDVNRTTDPDTAASGVDETGDLDQENDTDTMAADNDLPDTGSELPLVGLVGLLALGGALAFRAAR
jgi:LPXTG-motif cell wall-anchored protein